jgi:hypothetical protein
MEAENDLEYGTMFNKKLFMMQGFISSYIGASNF